MTQPVTMPLWAFILIVLFALVTLASHFLFPSVRWFFRKRAERVIAKLNERLQRPIEPFKLARRHDMIQRLIYDPEVTLAIVEHARENDVPENVAFEKAGNYAREIVPSFSATAYFSVGIRFAKFLGRTLYRVRLGAFDRTALEALDDEATIIFVINHRSNMDYVLVTYLISRAGTLSYAVGEWARVWPLSVIIRAMGAYFIRRRSRGKLYRKVLARYVQMATNGGVTQAMFPEGGLSLNGKVGAPKLGLLNYIVTGNDPAQRAVVFVPVALNYDRVLEDRYLVAADLSGVRKFRPPVTTLIAGALRYLWYRITGKLRGFGTASVGFGIPLELSTFQVDAGDDRTEAVANELMARIRAVVPILAVPLVSHVLLQGGATTRGEMEVQIAEHLAALRKRAMPLPKRNAPRLVADTLARFLRRGFVVCDGDQVVVTDEGRDILQYYANTIAHHMDETVEISATAK